MLNRRIYRGSMVAGLIGVAGLLAACGGSASGGTSGDGSPSSATITIPKADRFDPLAIAVRQGTRVSWSNLDSDAHTVLTDPTDAVQFTFVAPARGSVSYTYDKVGIFPYYCDAHATWNADIKRVQARPGSSEYPAAMEGVVFVLP